MVFLRLIAIVLVALAISVDADVSPLQLRRLSATEGTFVRGMMAADHQFELYMTMTTSDDEENIAKSSRHGHEGRSESKKNDVMSVSRGGSSSSSPIMHMHRAVGQARDAAVTFVEVMRRRAFSPPIQSRKTR
ncbi:hypothetical protein ACHAWU_003502 [Discostella pseudostelligera]|jgi:hypothetical protein|uniref:Uncharacterized protein n=1 Tax=Discostella pseudostelligera TaxID=259834 RepID=A0ABD3LZF0_9STRA